MSERAFAGQQTWRILFVVPAHPHEFRKADEQLSCPRSFPDQIRNPQLLRHQQLDAEGVTD